MRAATTTKEPYAQLGDPGPFDVVEFIREAPEGWYACVWAYGEPYYGRCAIALSQHVAGEVHLVDRPIDFHVFYVRNSAMHDDICYACGYMASEHEC